MIPRLTAQASRLQPPSSPGSSSATGPSPSLGDALPVLGAALLVVSVIAASFALVFKLRRRRRRHESGRRTGAAASPKPETGSRIRRPQRPRNPTLAETKGLPPIRDGNPPAPTS
jgi:hypothetical protein